MTQVVDLINGAGNLMPSDVLIYHLNGGRVIVRPSGTEPKIKAYLESVDPDQAKAEARLEALRQAVPALMS